MLRVPRGKSRGGERRLIMIPPLVATDLLCLFSLDVLLVVVHERRGPYASLKRRVAAERLIAGACSLSFAWCMAKLPYIARPSPGSESKAYNRSDRSVISGPIVMAGPPMVPILIDVVVHTKAVHSWREGNTRSLKASGGLGQGCCFVT
jgi:hypothetical protein